MTNVLGRKLKVCGLDPLTGYSRNGYCNADMYDYGTHIVCANSNKRFSKFYL